MSQGSYYYMKLKGPDVPGSCKKKGYEDWCEVNSWGLNISNPVDVTKSTGGSLGTPNLSLFSITKVRDKASPKISKMLMTGEHFDEIIFEGRRTGQKGEEGPVFIRITLRNAKIAGVTPDTSSSNAPEPVSFAYDDVTLEYFQVKVDGSQGPRIAAKYNVGSRESNDA
ncbi:MAG: type VI secretion system tube protein Hcp [Acidobacteria bacterium]|nr:type VI secretion system tube protein Hcp [Acidobacteriota bacterium]